MNGGFIVGGGVSTTTIVLVPESTTVRPTLTETVMVKFPALVGFPLRIPVGLKVKPGGTPVALQTLYPADVVMFEVNFTFGLGEVPD
jgi:hypothetical protein